MFSCYPDGRCETQVGRSHLERGKKATRAGRSDAQRRDGQASRFARILTLLELLQGRGRSNAAALAAELEATRRPVHRDLRVLELAGVPCAYDRETGGYVLQGDYRFAVTGLTDDELLGQARSGWSCTPTGSAGTSFNTRLKSANSAGATIKSDCTL